VFARLRNFSAARSSLVFEAATASDTPLDAGTIEVVMEDLKSEDRQRQQDAFLLISTLGFWIVPQLIEVIKRESNMRARHLAAELIKNKGDSAVVMFKKSLMNESRSEYRARILDVIDAVTTDLMLELSDTLSDSADVVRRSAFRLAERLNTPAVISLLTQLSRHDDPDLAAPAIHSLAKLNAPGVVETLVAVAETSDAKEVLAAACRAMGQIADPAFVAVLENILMPKRRMFFQKKTDTAVRIAALYALSRISDIRVAPLLKILADDPDYRVREALKNLDR
jgi:HEAT repeat protein